MRQLLAGFGLISALTVSGAVVVRMEQDDLGTAFHGREVPPPSMSDAATDATFSIVSGSADGNSGTLAVLHDGKVPEREDQPEANFFFQAGSQGGRILIDLGRVVNVAQINTYSWHPGGRGPQVYSVWGAKDTPPANADDLTTAGWHLIAMVDTRGKFGTRGGQYAVSLQQANGAPLGAMRQVLLEVKPTSKTDRFGQTFFSEIDIIDAVGPPPQVDPTIADKRPARLFFKSVDNKTDFIIDATNAPELEEWSANTLRPVIVAWYPRLESLLTSEGFTAPRRVTLRFKRDMGGVPAAAGGSVVSLNAQWFTSQLQREARGAVIHELVHIVQDYGYARKVNTSPAPVPGWIVEGIADYVRWFIYEPESRGAEITRHNIENAHHDASYRVSANFLDWATSVYGKQLVRNLNAAARHGRYNEELWRRWTGKSLPELEKQWLAARRAQSGL